MPSFTVNGIDENQTNLFFSEVVIKKITPLLKCDQEAFSVIYHQTKVFSVNKKIIIRISWIKRPIELQQEVAKIITNYFNSIFPDAVLYLIFEEINDKLYVNGIKK